MFGTGARRCDWVFDEYVSSPWEREWLETGRFRERSACENLASSEAKALSEQWVQARAINDPLPQH